MAAWEVRDGAILKTIQVAFSGSVHAGTMEVTVVVISTISLSEWNDLQVHDSRSVDVEWPDLFSKQLGAVGTLGFGEDCNIDLLSLCQQWE